MDSAVALKSEFETLSLYGISIEYPKAARLELNRKSTREQGDVVFHFHRREKIVLSWGSLEEARRHYDDANAQAVASIDRAKKSQQIRNMQCVERKDIPLKGHEAVYNHMRFEVVSRGILRERKIAEQETHSVHLHCPESGRFYVLYGSATSFPDASDQRSVLLAMTSSLKCH